MERVGIQFPPERSFWGMLGRYGAVVAALGLSLLLVPAGGADAAWLPAQDAIFLRAAHEANLAEISAGSLALGRRRPRRSVATPDCS